MNQQAEILDAKKPEFVFATSGAESRDGRWFHYDCFIQDDKGFGYAQSFPKRAKSEHTKCLGCRLTINGKLP